MRIAVSYRKEDGGFGGRLRDDLEHRLTRDAVSQASEGAAFDVLVAVIGPQPSLTQDRLGRALERAVRADAPIVLVTLEGAAVPASEDLPTQLAALGELDPIPASDDYWDASVDRVVKRVESLRSRRRGRLAELLLRQSRRVKVGATVGVVGGIVGILVALGVIGPDPSQRAAIEVSGNAASGVTYEAFLELFEPGADPTLPYPVPEDTEGYGYDVHVTLDDPESDRYALRWTERIAADGKPIDGRRDLVGARLRSDQATGVHRVWVPCPPPALDAVRYIVEFVLVDESQPGAPPLDRADGPSGECMFVEP